jgi:methylmalonyl-CoA/ethylmalonyl-CoA epimerase
MENAEQGVRLAYIELHNGRIELMEPSRPDSPVSKFLERNPKGGIHHLCLGVDNVAKAARAFGENGVRVLGEGQPQRNVAGAPIAFIHPSDFLGALVELEQHKS